MANEILLYYINELRLNSGVFYCLIWPKFVSLLWPVYENHIKYLYFSRCYPFLGRGMFLVEYYVDAIAPRSYMQPSIHSSIRKYPSNTLISILFKLSLINTFCGS